MQVWVITTHTGHGEDAGVMGVYANPEAARTALEAEKNMLVYVIGGPDDPGDEAEYYLAMPAGTLVGVPADGRKYPHVFAAAEAMEIIGECGVTEYGTRANDGGFDVWPPDNTDYPTAKRIGHALRDGRTVLRRRVIVAGEWEPVTRKGSSSRQVDP